MDSSIITAMISLIGTLGGSLGGILVSSKLTAYRLEQLEARVAEHNNFARRMPVIEEQIKVINHRSLTLKRRKSTMKIDWKRKLTSRKLWIAAAGFVAGLIAAFGGSSETAETVSGCILSGAAVVGYVIGEGLADSGRGNGGGDGDNF